MTQESSRALVSMRISVLSIEREERRGVASASDAQIRTRELAPMHVLSWHPTVSASGFK